MYHSILVGGSHLVYCKPGRFVSRLNWGCTRRERERHLEQYWAHSFSLASLAYKFTRGRKRILLNELGEIMTGIN